MVYADVAQPLPFFYFVLRNELDSEARLVLRDDRVDATLLRLVLLDHRVCVCVCVCVGEQRWPVLQGVGVYYHSLFISLSLLLQKCRLLRATTVTTQKMLATNSVQNVENLWSYKQSARNLIELYTTFQNSNS